MKISQNLSREKLQDEFMLTKSASKEAKRQAIIELTSCVLDLDKTFSDDRNLLYFNGTPFLRKGNISIIQGKPKSGKSYFCSMLAAAAIAGEYEDLTANQRKPVSKLVYFDTEQSEEYASKQAKRIMTMAGKPDNRFPDNFSVYSFRKLSPPKARTLFETAFLVECPNIVILDGITDLVDSPNDELEAKQRVAWLYNLAEAYDSHIIVVIHENSGSFDKARGHIGSELERKVETGIQLEVCRSENNQIKRVEYKLSRGASPDNFQFTIDGSGFPHIEPWTEPNTGQEPKVSKEDVTLYRLKAAFDGKEMLSKDNLKVAIMANAGVSETTARREIYSGEGLGYLVLKGNSYIFTKASLNLAS